MKRTSFALLCLLALAVASQADVEIGEENWESVLASNRQTFVKFYSPYCGWCQKLAPLWTELTSAFDGALNVVSVDITVHKKLATAQAINGVPTMRLFHGSKYAGDFTGPRTQNDVSEWLFKHMLPVQLTFDSKDYQRYTTAAYSNPVRFLYLYPEGDKIDTSKLQKAVMKGGIYAECAVPSDLIPNLLTTRSLKELPALVTVSTEAWFNTEITAGTVRVLGDGTKATGKRFGDDSIDTHSSFTFIFFLLGIIGIGVFAWRQLALPKRSLESAKSV